ncbi:MAG: UPF0179 family protein [Candidatus Thermoplasmatota archaeon]|jgi:uncharacterized protein (UPF0179 family)|nr:UPF0179 family protein [Candidatus Thermoplasmatota archaeon]MCL5988319.1 UPF0179 family protein [Candidatus Thermoplasmatota archaeon]
MASKVTLIGLDQAEVGNVFRYITPLQVCSDCKVKGACFTLEKGKTYRINEVREKEHPCKIFNHDMVRVVSVEEAMEEFIVPYDNRVQEGSTLNIGGMDCDYITCDFIEKCNLLHNREDVKVKISKIERKVDCPKNYDMRAISGTKSTGKK